MPLRRRPTPVSPREWAVLTRHPARTGPVDAASPEGRLPGGLEPESFEPYVAAPPGTRSARPRDEPVPHESRRSHREEGRPHGEGRRARREGGRGERDDNGLRDEVGHDDEGWSAQGSGRPAWVRVPPVLRSARAAVSGPALVGVTVVVAVVALVLGLRVAWADSGSARPAPTPSMHLTTTSPSASTSGGPAAGGSASGGPASGPRAASAGTGEVVVDIVGQVAKPGIVRLPAGSRVTDAVTAAGGALPGADVARVNLARVLVDGEQIRIPAPGEELPPVGAGAAGAGSGSGPVATSGGLVNLNTADLGTLDTLPGVGPVLAQRIVDWRATHGRFTSIDELGEVSGIGQRLLEQLRSRVTV